MTVRMATGYRAPFQDLDLTGFRISNRNRRGLGMVQTSEKTRVCVKCRPCAALIEGRQSLRYNNRKRPSCQCEGVAGISES